MNVRSAKVADGAGTGEAGDPNAIDEFELGVLVLEDDRGDDKSSSQGRWSAHAMFRDYLSRPQPPPISSQKPP